MRRKNVRLVVVLWVSRTAAEVHKTIGCQSGNSCWLLQSIAYHHTYLVIAFCLQRMRTSFSSKSITSCRVLFSFAQQRILFEALLSFHCPFPLSSKFISSHRQCASGNCASHRHVASKEFIQPSKVDLSSFALKIPADASLSGKL